jgi:uncharacterized LabA/DUF88 family protein
MSNETTTISFRTFILLIDADNTSTDLFPQIMQKVEDWGTITIRRVYGNQQTLLSQKWKELCLQYALQPIPHIGISGAKNATDIALTVDAMDLLWLYKDDMPNFCLITGDQDFTALVLRLRSQGCHVYCLGKPTKAEALAKACTQFISVEEFSASAVIPKPKTKPKGKQPTPKQSHATKAKQSQVQKKTLITKATQPPLSPTIITFLTQTIEKVSTEKNIEWISVPSLGSKLKQLDAQFQAKTYGYKNLPELIKSQTDLFEHRQQGAHLEVRLKLPRKKIMDTTTSRQIKGIQ